MKRQLDILNCFVKGDFKKVKQLHEKLPYCKKTEISEKEFVGHWMEIAFGKTINYHSSLIKEDHKIELEK